ncbi:MAG: methyltransferase domain-containing protein [Candidatus Obscuribacterales bacterium]|nr:methyltransferase domain-containing protein [Candidatus Obscuribacterales bacterium]
MKKSDYLLENSNVEAGRRFEALSAIFDKVTFAHCQRLGLSPGWNVWEVGAGGTSVVQWLADRVGSSGTVTATDIDVSWASTAIAGNVAISKHDVVSTPLQEGFFDLVHTRLVLVHVPERQTALQNMIRALRPGGLLLLEDADPALQPMACINESGPPQVLANKLRHAFRHLMASRGVDLAYGRKLPALLREQGLEDVGADCYFPVAEPFCNILEIATVKLIAPQILAANLATKAELDQHISNVASGALDLTTAPLISAWGKKP